MNARHLTVDKRPTDSRCSTHPCDRTRPCAQLWGQLAVFAKLDLHTEWLGMDLAWGPQCHVQLLDIESVEPAAAAAMHRDASSGRWH
jgi:hypothetical protein